MDRVVSIVIGVVVAAVIIVAVLLVADRHSSNDNGPSSNVLNDYQPRLTVDGKITDKVIADRVVVAQLPKRADGTCGPSTRYGVAISPPPGATPPRVTLDVDAKTCELVAHVRKST